MLTGQRAFKGEDVSETLAFILTREPDWATLPADTPPLIRRLLRRCLEKDRKRRLDSAADARLEIDEALTSPAVADSDAARPAPTPRSAWSRALPWAALGALATGLLLMLAQWAPWRAEKPVDRPLVRLDVIWARMFRYPLRPQVAALSSPRMAHGWPTPRARQRGCSPDGWINRRPHRHRAHPKSPTIASPTKDHDRRTHSSSGITLYSSISTR
jgi:hypothetical protein